MTTLGRPRGTSARRCTALARAAVCVAPILAWMLFASPAEAGQIVYSHGGGLWVMNDDGSAQRPLATSTQIGGAIDAGNTADPQPVSVQPGGTGIAFVAPPGGTCGSQTSNCPALYSLVGGHLTRLTAPAAPCGNAGVICASEEENPAVTADGRVVYDRLDVASAFICPFYCGFSGGYSEAYYSRRLDGSDAPTPWPVPTGSNDPEGKDPNFEGPIASDPADPSKLAYQGNYVAGLSETLYPVDVDNAATNPPTVNQPALDDSFLYGLAFSGDGSLLADIETGGEKGIWVYPAGQEASESTPFYWALEDPDNGQGTSLDHFVSGLAFVGDGALVFSADYNLYSIPARCWATPVGEARQANCHFPQDATRLTSDGTASAPDTSPAWTSSTSPIAAISTGTTPPQAHPISTHPPHGGPIHVTNAVLSGVSKRRAHLSFTVAAGAALKKIVVKLPPGLSLAGARKALRRGVRVSSAGGKQLAFTAAVVHGALTITLKHPAPEVLVSLGPPALRVTSSLAAKVKAGRVKKLPIAVTATETGGTSSHLSISVKPR